MVNEFKLSVVYFARLKPDAHGFTARQKTVENQDWAASRSAFEPLGRRGKALGTRLGTS